MDVPIRFGTNRKMFSCGPDAPVVSVAAPCASPLPFVRIFCSAAGSGAGESLVFAVEVSSAAAAAAKAACRRVRAPDMMAL